MADRKKILCEKSMGAEGESEKDENKFSACSMLNAFDTTEEKKNNNQTNSEQMKIREFRIKQQLILLWSAIIMGNAKMKERRKKERKKINESIIVEEAENHFQIEYVYKHVWRGQCSAFEWSTAGVYPNDNKL